VSKTLSFPSSTTTNFRQNTQRYAAILVFIMASALIYRFYRVVSRYSVNLFFFDEWDVYDGLFRAWPWWRFFLQEHGPHRQGLGVTVVVWLLRAAHWDSRVQAYAIATAIVLAMLSAIWLKTLLFGPLQIFDLIIPVLFLGLGQWEVLLSAPGPSAQAFPLLLLILYCLAWAQEKTWLRYATVVVVNFLLIYTGYGIFVSLITLGLLAIDVWQKKRAGEPIIAPLAALIASTLSLGCFFYKYVFNPAAACYRFPYPNPAAYPWFMALMFARFLGMKHGAILRGVVGLAVLLVIVAVCVRSLWSVRRRLHRVNAIVLVLAGYSLIYATAAAIGRVCLGMQAAESSRNITLLIPAFLGIYFYLLNRKQSHCARIAIPILLVAVLPSCIQRNHKEIEGFAAMKQSWKNCYLTHENIAYCDAVSHLQLYPAPNATHLRDKLRYLKENHLNLYVNAD
jgi:hypothetical protein